MKLSRVSVLFIALAFFSLAANAQLTPGFVVQSGEPFPDIADFNGDGLDDLIQERNVILNTGGAFTVIRDLGLPEGERVIAVLDVNGDHIPDLLTEVRGMVLPPSIGGGGGGSTYRLYIGNAARTYANPILLTSGAAPLIADVDGDGKDDILLMKDIRPDGFQTIGTDVTILRSLGDGTFETLPTFRVPPDPQYFDTQRVMTGDLNHDGKIDLVFRCPEDIAIAHGLGGGRFAVESHYMPENMQYGWWSNRLADIDGDGNLDIVLAGFRIVRVLFGDGRGNFPRMAVGTIPQLHPTSVPAPFAELLKPDQLNQPRNIAIGHFTRTDRIQIAAGMSEGDIVTLSWQDGALKEDSRVGTDFWAVAIRPGTFHTNGLNDIYAMGTLIWGDIYPRPRVFDGTAGTATATTQEVIRTRHRVFGAGTNTVETQMNITMSGDCFDTFTARWTFPRNGFFGDARRENSLMEAVFDGPNIYYRLHAPFSNYPMTGTLTLNDGVYSGTTNFVPLCGGLHTLTITATME